VNCQLCHNDFESDEIIKLNESSNPICPTCMGYAEQLVRLTFLLQEGQINQERFQERTDRIWIAMKLRKVK